MTINTKLTESFRAQIKNIFKESADMVASATPPVAPPAPAPMPPTGGASAPVDSTLPPQEEEQKVTLTVSLLKSLLDWVNGEEDTEGEEGIDDGSEVPSTDTPPVAPVTEQASTVKPKPVTPPKKPLSMSPNANPSARSTGMGIKEEAPVAPPVDETSSSDETSSEGEDEESGVDSMDIETLVNKVAELGQTKPLLTDEDFGEIVAAVDTEGGDSDLSGVLDDDNGEDIAPPAAPAVPVKEDIGQVVPRAPLNNVDKGIQNPINKGKPV